MTMKKCYQVITVNQKDSKTSKKKMDLGIINSTGLEEMAIGIASVNQIIGCRATAQNRWTRYLKTNKIHVTETNFSILKTNVSSVKYGGIDTLSISVLF